MALMSAGRCSPEPSRECSSMFLTIESARLPCCTTFSRLPLSMCVSSSISSRVLSSIVASLSTSFISSISSADNAEKLLTKLSGFLISWAMPAVSWPSEASFSVCTRRSCAVRSSSSDCDSSSVRSLQFVEQAGVLDRDHGLVGEVGDQLDLLVGERLDLLPIDRDRADQFVFLQHRHDHERSGAGKIGQRANVRIALDDRAAVS